MKRFPSLILLIVVSISGLSCNKDHIPDKPQKFDNKLEISDSGKTSNKENLPKANRPEDFIPKEMVLFEKIEGDLNSDGLEDCVLIVKQTEKNVIVTDRFEKEADLNRRGIIILFKKNNFYTKILENKGCFSSEQEDGGVYFPPELMVEIQKNKLFIHYAHGRYGYWRYTFRYQNSDFDLIGYDESDNHGPLVENETSINFLTKKLIYKKNTNMEATSGDEIFEITKRTLPNKPLLKLSQVKDFDDLKVYDYKILGL